MHITFSRLAFGGLSEIPPSKPTKLYLLLQAASFFIYSKNNHSALGGQIVNKKLGSPPADAKRVLCGRAPLQRILNVSAELRSPHAGLLMNNYFRWFLILIFYLCCQVEYFYRGQSMAFKYVSARNFDLLVSAS